MGALFHSSQKLASNKRVDEMSVHGIRPQTHHKRIPTPLLERVLRDIAHRIPELHWATIASLDGVSQATYDPFQRENPDRILAAASAVLALGTRVFHKLQRGKLTHLTLAGDMGVLIARPVTGEYMLVVSIPPTTETGSAAAALAQAALAFERVFHHPET
jgi:predicted regulator of Ras-like GTPase activity (Roadblock/LC7/MglB family)